MNQPHTPRVASWFLRHFGCSPKNDSLLGDLIEQYQQGRSRTWFWYQVIVAIAAGLIGEIREHKLLALRAVVVGWSAPALYSLVLHAFIIEMLWKIEPWAVVQHPAFYHFFFRNLEKFFWGEGQSGMLAEMLVATCVLGLTSGWLVARLNRVHPRAMVLTYLASDLIYLITVWTYLLMKNGITWILPPYLPILLFSGLATLLSVVSILIGGGLLLHSNEHVLTQESHRISGN